MKFILPSILSADFANLGAQVKELEDNGIEIVHIDITQSSTNNKKIIINKT